MPDRPYPGAEEIFRDIETRIEEAKELLGRASPLEEGSPQWLYLTQHRRLPADTVRAALPDLRAHEPRLPGRGPHEYATCSLLRDAAGAVSGFQLTFHDVSGRPALGTEGAPKRQTYALRMDGCRDGLFRTAGAEGADTAYLVEGYLEKVIALAGAGLRPVYGWGSLTVLGYAVPPEPTVVIVPDRRPTGERVIKHDRHMTAGIDRLKLAGKAVLVAPAPDCAHAGSVPCKDSDDYLRRHGPILLKALVDGAAETALSLQGEARRLAAIRDPLERDKETSAAASRLGVRVVVLRGEVARLAKAGADGGDDARGGTGLRLEDPVPWPDKVDGAGLLDNIVAAFERYLALRPHVAVALWAMHTHCFEAFDYTPRLAVTSPLPRCGKTTLLKVLGRIVPRPLFTANTTMAVVFRLIEKHKPTVLIDEADSFLRDSEDLRGALNAGFERGGVVHRTVGDDHEPKEFRVWAPAAIAAIKALHPTLADRAVAVPMRRRAPGEREVERFRARQIGYLEDLRRRAARWASDNAVALGQAQPHFPEGLSDRAADAWEPLLAIADRAGGPWPERARKAALALSNGGDVDEDHASIVALGDIKELFDAARKRAREAKEHYPDILFTQDILTALIAMTDRPWAEWRNGNAITPYQLGRLLHPYGIRPRTVRRGGREMPERKGYRREDFEDAFARYLPQNSVTPSHTKEAAAFSGSSPSHEASGVTDFESEKTGDFSGVTGVADSNGAQAEGYNPSPYPGKASEREVSEENQASSGAAGAPGRSTASPEASNGAGAHGPNGAACDTRQCLTCGRMFEVPEVERTPQKFCGKRCRQRHDYHRKRGRDVPPPVRFED